MTKAARAEIVTLTMAELTMAPWAAGSNLYITTLPKVTYQAQLSLLLLLLLLLCWLSMLLAFLPMTLCQGKLTFSLAHVSNDQSSKSRNSNTDTDCAFLGSLGSMTTNKIDLLHYHSAQGAIASATIIIVTNVAPAIFLSLLLAFLLMTLCQCKLTFSLAHVSDDKGSSSRNSNTVTSWAYLGPLGSMIDPLHHHTAQGIIASAAIIVVTIAAPATFLSLLLAFLLMTICQCKLTFTHYKWHNLTVELKSRPDSK
jgi:hypothetical protein